MSGQDPRTHPTEDLLDRFAEGDFAPEEATALGSHVAACADCRRKVEEYRAFFGTLSRLPVPEVPPGFAVRILDAVLPKTKSFPKSAEDKAVVRLVTRLYATVAVALSTVAAVMLGMSGPGPVTWAFAHGFSRSVEGTAAWTRNAAVAGVDLVLAFLELAPLAGVARSVLRSFETAALALAPFQLAFLLLTLSLATLVLIWAMSPARERGVPHVSLTL
jgi:anti-sigma factor RsiW